MNRHHGNLLCSATLAAACLCALGACERSAPPPANAAAPAAASSDAQRAVADASVDAGASDARSASARVPAAIAVAAATPVYRQIRDFVIGCDTARRCTIVAAAENVDSAATLQLILRRDAGPDGVQELSIASPERPLTAAALRLDGAPLPGAAALPWVRGDDTTLRLTAPDAIAHVIDVIRSGSTLGMAGDDTGAAMSLSGLAAALLLVDEQQQRLDTPAAWLRRGTRADADVPAAPRLPTLPPAPAAPPALSDADGARVVAMVRSTQAPALRAEECVEARRAGDDTGFDITRDDTAEPLDATHAIVFITCLSGAYQSSSLAFIAPRDGRGGAKRVALPPLPFDAGDERGDGADRFAMLTNAGYDPATATLSHFAKGRGLADCGESATWRYDGRVFQLAEFSQMTRCSGGAPGEWPTLWRTAGGDAPK